MGKGGGIGLNTMKRRFSMKRPLAYITAAWCGEDYKNMEQAARCTLYDKDGTPHVCVDTHMKRCLETRLIRAIVRK